ncbi:MAG: hypothetical protein RJA61_87 [Candidatus Parcubacteria bacterium]|jgi:uncharacterized protein YdhG (YjbR/CyaY superfamily)
MKKDTSAITTIDEYIALFSKEVQSILNKVRNTIQKSAPLAEETIKYGIPTFVLNKKNLVHFGAFEKHIGFYPAPSGITHFKKELAVYETAKGSVQFPFSKPIPYDLIGTIVTFRVNETNK